VFFEVFALRFRANPSACLRQAISLRSVRLKADSDEDR
jgi:hypothetical protein